MKLFAIQGKIMTPALVNPLRRSYIIRGRRPPSRVLNRTRAAGLLLPLVLALLCLCWQPAGAVDGIVPAVPEEPAPPKLTLSEAVMCEALDGYAPENPAVVFSVARQRVFCFTAFDPVPKKTVIYHKWYRRDVLTATVKLQLSPPRWVTFSNMQLRESDKGPWQVKITDADGNVFRILRYSITD